VSIGPYWVGDSPATPIEIDLFSDEDTAAYPAALVSLYGPEGALVSTFPMQPVVDQTIVLTLPMDPFDEPGIYNLTVRLMGTDGHLVTLPDVPLVVQARTGWHSLDSARADWEQAPASDVTLHNLLETARIECQAFAPARAMVPANYRAAQLLQARNSLNAGQVQPSGDFGSESFQMTPFPLDWKVKQLLRPLTGRPLVG
jgi:hypothetical protein